MGSHSPRTPHHSPLTSHHSPLSTHHGLRMEIKRGIAVSPGVAIGPALVLDTEGFRIPQRFVHPEEVAEEIARLKRALAAAATQTRETQQAVAAKLGEQYGAIFGSHALMLS